MTPLQTQITFAVLLVFFAVLILYRARIKNQKVTFYLILMGIHCAYWFINWNKIGVPFSDLGTILYVPKRVLEGQTLYQDIFWHYGPIEPYFNAFLYKIFGLHTSVLQTEAFVLHFGILSLIYLNIIRLTKPVVGFTAGLLAYSLCQSASHIAFPYSFSAVYALFTTLILISILPKWIEQKKLSTLLCMAFIAGIGGLTKQNFGFYVFVGLGLFLVLELFFLDPERNTIPRSQKFKCLALYTLVTGLVTGLPFGYVIFHLGQSVLFENIIPTFQVYLYQKGYLIALKEELAKIPVLSILDKLIILSLHGIILVGLFGALFGLMRRKAQIFSKQDRLCAGVLCIAWFLILTYNYHYTHGFTMAPVTLIVAAWIFTNGKEKWFAGRYITVLCLALIALSTLFLSKQFRWDNSKTYLMETKHVKLYEGKHLAEPMVEIAKYIREHSQTEDTLLVIPHQSLIYLLSGLDTPLRQNYVHMPGYLPDEEQAIAILKEKKTKFLVHLLDEGIPGSNHFSSKGREELWVKQNIPLDVTLRFGVHFAKLFGTFMRNNYHPVLENGQFILYERNKDQPSNTKP